MPTGAERFCSLCLRRFAAVLREQYDSSVPSAAQEFHRRLAVWFGAHSEENHTSLAFHHAVLGKDWDLMDQLWSENVPMMLMGDVGLLDETLAMLPAPVLATRPSMQVFRGICQSCAQTATPTVAGPAHGHSPTPVPVW